MILSTCNSIYLLSFHSQFHYLLFSPRHINLMEKGKGNKGNQRNQSSVPILKDGLPLHCNTGFTTGRAQTKIWRTFQNHTEILSVGKKSFFLSQLVMIALYSTCLPLQLSQFLKKKICIRLSPAYK